jgi:pimeloyl-ACP methyl ester carboxylesterase
VENVVQLIPATFGIAVILPDHRGTGLATVLDCDNQDSQNVTADCITYLTLRWEIEGLHQLSITVAAHDLSLQIQSYQIDHPVRVSIYGLSYGTQWLDRFLQICPTLVQSAVMDGVVNRCLSSVSRYDISVSDVGSQFLTYCQMQLECSQHFPVYQLPYIMLYRILTELDANSQKCVNDHFTRYQLTLDRVRSLLFGMIQSGEQYMIVPSYFV